MDAQKFGAFIAQCRKEKSMTQSELAAKIMVTDKAVSRWERGKGFPDINLLLPLAEALEVSVLELMHSERQKDKVQLFQDDTIIVHLMENAVEMNKQNKQQDRIIACISCITMFFVTFFIKFYGYGSRRFYCIYSHRVLSSYQQQERHHRQKNLYYIYGAGNLSDFSFIDFFACKFTDPYMGNFLSPFPYHNCADSIMYFHADIDILKK